MTAPARTLTFEPMTTWLPSVASGSIFAPSPIQRPSRATHAGDVDHRLAVEHVSVRLHVRLAAADVAPVAVEHASVQGVALLHQKREQVAREVEGRAFGHEVEHPRLDDVDAGVDRVREDLAPRGLLEEAFDAPVFVGDDHTELERIGHALERDGDRAALLAVEVDDLGQIEVRERVAGDDEEGLAFEE